MIQLFPTPDSPDAVDRNGPPPVTDTLAAVLAEVRPTWPDRPWIYTNMIASADGGTAVDGLSGALGGPGDKLVFSALRSAADGILVGASTAREERYRAPQPSEAARAARRDRGHTGDPRLVLVTRSLDLDPDLPLFGEPSNRPVIVTVSTAPEARRARLEPVADLIDAGRADVDLAVALRRLRAEGMRTMLSEGGPSLNGQLVEHDLVDEWNLSLSPHLIGGDSRRAAVGPAPGGPPRPMQLARIWCDDDYLFCRWVRPDRPEAGA